MWVACENHSFLYTGPDPYGAVRMQMSLGLDPFIGLGRRRISACTIPCLEMAT